MVMKTSKHHPNRPELLEKIQVVHLVPKQCLSALQNFPIELILVTGFCGPKQGNRGRKCGARFWSFCSGAIGGLVRSPTISRASEITLGLFLVFSNSFQNPSGLSGFTARAAQRFVQKIQVMVKELSKVIRGKRRGCYGLSLLYFTPSPPEKIGDFGSIKMLG